MGKQEDSGKGIKFVSTSNFLSFVDEELPEVEDMEENNDNVTERASESPVVRLKRLSFEDGVFESKGGGHTRLKSEGRRKECHAKLKVAAIAAIPEGKEEKWNEAGCPS